MAKVTTSTKVVTSIMVPSRMAKEKVQVPTKALFLPQNQNSQKNTSQAQQQQHSRMETNMQAMLRTVSLMDSVDIPIKTAVTIKVIFTVDKCGAQAKLYIPKVDKYRVIKDKSIMVSTMELALFFSAMELSSKDSSSF